jgi:hypothetical protein
MGLLCLAGLTGAASGQVAGTSTAQNPTATFSTPGNKQVSLKVCNAIGCSTMVKTVVVLDPRPVIASVASVPPVVGLGLGVSLSAQTSGRPALTHRWVISRGAASLVVTGNPVVWDTNLSGVGDYTVHLEVQNQDATVSSAPFPVSVHPVTFADVTAANWAWQYIETLAASGITTGCAANPARYCPLTNVLRAEMAVFLVRGGHGVAFVPPLPIGLFADVPPTYWAAPQIEQVYVDGLTTGCAAGPLRFCPDSQLSRAEMAVFLLRAEHGSLYVPPPATGTRFADVSAAFWAAPWIEQLYAEGITTGCDSNPLRFCPASNVSRDQMAAFLVRTFKLTLP